MTSKLEIKQIITMQLIKDNSIVFAYIFGSFVESYDYNDIDLAVYSENNDFDTIKLACELEKLLKINIDVIDIRKVPDNLIHSISKGEIIIDKDENFRTDFFSAAWSKYQDFKYFRNRFLKELSYD